MADAELFDEFEDRELRTLEIFLTAKAAKSAVTIEEFIQTQLAQGNTRQSIRNLLISDLKEGGRIFGEFRAAIKSTTRGSLNRIRDSALYSEYGVDREYRWIAVLVNTCPDCLANHGRVMTWDDWEVSTFGLPRSGGTICRENCRCVLVISEATEIEPLIRKKSGVVSPRSGRVVKTNEL